MPSATWPRRWQIQPLQELVVKEDAASKIPLLRIGCLHSCPSIGGDESFETIDDRYDDITTISELVIPGSDHVMKWAMSKSEKIADNDMNAHESSALVNRVSKELHALLKVKTTLKAKTHVRAVHSHQGLEAFRMI